ncbi:hypothetical protein M426DRAFT_253356 [Hypoxylon sp. CI-4A]|nr:hypothetical protein M426DRAFT_253356 [Hypoxylon sp. CI-4A]
MDTIYIKPAPINPFEVDWLLSAFPEYDALEWEGFTFLQHDSQLVGLSASAPGVYAWFYIYTFDTEPLVKARDLLKENYCDSFNSLSDLRAVGYFDVRNINVLDALGIENDRPANP